MPLSSLFPSLFFQHKRMLINVTSRKFYYMYVQLYKFKLFNLFFCSQLKTNKKSFAVFVTGPPKDLDYYPTNWTFDFSSTQSLFYSWRKLSGNIFQLNSHVMRRWSMNWFSIRNVLLFSMQKLLSTKFPLAISLTTFWKNTSTQLVFLK